jgi:isocitrate dehydrogenase
VIGRHAFGDQYRATDAVLKGKGKLTMTFTPENGEPQTWEVYDFKGDGVALSMYNTDESILALHAAASTWRCRRNGRSTSAPRTPS